MFLKSPNTSLYCTLHFRAFEQDSLSGRSDFPWMQLHCNFRGLATGPKSDRNIPAASSEWVSERVSVCVRDMLLEQLLQKQMKLNFKLAVAQRRGGGSHLVSHRGAPSQGAAGGRGRRGPVGGARGRANDRRGFRWRHVVARLEFCLRRLRPPFPGSSRRAAIDSARRPRLPAPNLWPGTPTVTELKILFTLPSAGVSFFFI